MKNTKNSPTKAWQKIEPDTIEAWLVSDNKQDQQLAEEALQQLGEEKAAEYLYRILRKERAIKTRIQNRMAWVMLSTSLLVVLFLLLLKKQAIVGCGLSVFNAIITITNSRIGKRMTTMQRRLAERALEKPRVQEIALVLESGQTLLQPAEPFLSIVTSLLRQVTPETKELIPEEFWKKFIGHLRLRVRCKNVVCQSWEQERVAALIELCGKTRYEPSLPLLTTFAEMEAKTAQYIEFKRLAARYVADWDRAPTTTMPTTTENTPLVAGKWYAR